MRIDMDELKALNTKPTTADALRHYREFLKREHGTLYNRDCLKCQRISWVELLIEEAERLETGERKNES